MEYLEGETLHERLKKKGPLPLDQALRYVIEIAVSRDGQRFLMIEHDPASLAFQIILNAFERADPTH